MKSNAIRDLVASIRSLNNQQLHALVEDAASGITTLKEQMKTMSAQYKIKSAIPIIRDLNVLKSKASAEIERRTK